MTESFAETIGCDLGDKQSELCILSSNREPQRPGPVKTTRKAMTAFFTRPRAHVVIEVGTHSRWVSELLEKLGHKVTVANPRKLQLISQSNVKRDVADADQSSVPSIDTERPPHGSTKTRLAMSPRPRGSS